MFKELRNKFLILNLVTISVMMLLAFSSIYLITYNNVRRDISMELHKISEFNPKIKEDIKEPKPNFNNNKPHGERSLSFSLFTDTNGNLLGYDSIFNMEEEFYDKAKTEALTTNKVTGQLKLDSNHWAYIIQSFSNGKRIVFLDITSQQGILTNLIYTFLLVALIMLIIIYFISRFFANRSIEPIKNAFDKQKQFIADASHELKTPLAVINTNVDVLLSNEKESVKSQSKWLYYIKSEVERMTKLTKDLLYLTQVDYSDVKMIFSEFSVSDAVENVLLTMEAIIFENNISLQYDIEPNLKLHGNSEQIKQVIMILLDNALKYTKEKGSVDVSLKKHQTGIQFTVTNTGKGISEEHWDKIFDRFYRLDKSRARNSGGYGLGLAIAKAIVEQHGGKISVKSIVDKATTFTVEFPI